MLFDSANLGYWILLGIGIFLFLLVIVSGGGEDQDIDTDADLELEVDADADFDADMDADVDADADADANGANNFKILEILSWFGVGKTPILILLAIDLSSWGLIGWILNVAFGNLIGNIPTGFLGGIIFIVSFIVSVWLGRLISRPIGKIFAGFGEDASGDRLIGCVGTVISKKLPYLIEGRIGQVDVYDQSSNLLTIEVALPDWAKVIPHRGEQVLIIDRQKHSYIVIRKDSSDEDKWFNSINN